MFDYTKAILNKTLSDLKLFAKIWTLSTLGIYTAYLVYAIATSTGIQIANIVLLSLTSLYLVFYIVLLLKNIDLYKTHKKIAKKIYKYSKFAINAVTLSLLLHAIWINPYNVHPFKLLATVCMALMLIVQVVLEIVIPVLEKRVNMFVEAIYADIEFVTKPVNAVKNVFKKITGQEVEPKKEKTDNRVFLDGLVKQERDAKVKDKSDTIADRTKKIAQWFETHITKNKDGKNDDDESVTVSTEQNEE